MAFFGNTPKLPDYEEPERKRPSEQATASTPSVERDPVRVLDREPAQVYLDLLQKLVRAGKPNKFFPDGRSVENLYYLMTPDANRGLQDSLRLNLRMGLPDEPEIGRVIADKEIASRFLSKHDFEELKGRTDDASVRLFKRVQYYREVNERSVPKRYNLELKLKRVVDDRKTAQFVALFERYDPGEGVFTQYTIHLSHQHQRWSRPKVELKGDDLQYTEGFRNVISRYSSDEAEFAFILLSNVEGITVEEVVRGRIGPLWMEGVRMPAVIQDLMHAHPGNLILNFPQERVALPDKEDKPDTNRDPFGRFYRESLDADSKALADARARKLGYVVHKERKFSCTPGILKPLNELLKGTGKPCVIYPIR